MANARCQRCQKDRGHKIYSENWTLGRRTDGDVGTESELAETFARETSSAIAELSRCFLSLAKISKKLQRSRFSKPFQRLRRRLAVLIRSLSAGWGPSCFSSLFSRSLLFLSRYELLDSRRAGRTTDALPFVIHPLLSLSISPSLTLSSAFKWDGGIGDPRHKTVVFI